jgi:ribonuclease VapC
MILDSSAVIAILFREPGYEVLLEKMVAADVLAIGAPTAAECAIVLTARLKKARGLLNRYFQEFSVSIIAFTEVHWFEALEAYQRFGKGRHAAGLNFGDCLSYATARLARKPLLCVGQDCARTDLDLA